jgi:hypothetical protein
VKGGEAVDERCGKCRFACDLLSGESRESWIQECECRRFPQFVERKCGEWCGEFKPREVGKSFTGDSKTRFADMLDDIEMIARHNEREACAKAVESTAVLAPGETFTEEQAEIVRRFRAKAALCIRNHK